MLLPIQGSQDDNVASRDLTNFSSATNKRRSVFEVTPVNISLLTELFRFVAKCPYKFDINTEAAIKIALELVLPS